MKLSRRVALNGVQLDSLDQRIVISAIEEAEGQEEISAVSTARGYGQRITNRHRDTLDLTVRFLLDIKKTDMAGRSALLDAINAWAAPGGVLTVGHRPGKQLKAVLITAPGGGDIFRWTNEFALVFRAYGVPYWEDVTATTATTDAGTSGSGTITVPGSAKAAAEFTIVNTSANTLTTVSVTIGGKTMTFDGLSLNNNGELTVDHIHTGEMYCLRARAGNTSVLAKRAGADEFELEPGSRAWSYTSNVSARITVSVKGRYL